MAAIIIAGTTYSAEYDSSLKETIKIGTMSRTFNGGLRSSVRAEKHIWTVSLQTMLEATFQSLVTATALCQVVACSGDILGSSYNCIVTVGEAKFEQVMLSDSKGFGRKVTVTLSEV